ncbi:peptide chain release factor 2 [Candidatus Saccharibacteria bacterium]|nr:peptide chain release factor 2 [Candidatus Saccharibacteria bacterium]
MDQLQKKLEALKNQVDHAVDKLNLARLERDIAGLRAKMSHADFWQDQAEAQEVSKQESNLSKKIMSWRKIQHEVNELIELVELDDDSVQEELTRQMEKIEKKFKELKKESSYRGPYDDHDIILSIYAGAGGTDAQDWAQMLLRMYTRWAEAKRLKIETIDQNQGDEAGIKSATLEISGGSLLYGKLVGENGVHRLVRLSPFNADNLRQTSFAKVEILPLISKPSDLVIDDKELKIDVYRAGGHGGQSVNTTDSAVRVTHLPTGISVAIQNERSQVQNKETALSILRSRLVTLQLEQHVQSLKELKGPNKSAEWGNQIRSYVLHPYKQVKDLRTEHETSEVDKVLDGNLDQFIDAWSEHALAV